MHTAYLTSEKPTEGRERKNEPTNTPSVVNNDRIANSNFPVARPGSDFDRGLRFFPYPKSQKTQITTYSEHRRGKPFGHNGQIAR